MALSLTISDVISINEVVAVECLKNTRSQIEWLQQQLAHREILAQFFIPLEQWGYLWVREIIVGLLPEL